MYLSPINSLHDLWCALDGVLDERVDTDNLPTFGGDEPQRTAGVFSWDDERILVGDSPRKVEFVRRQTVRVWWDERGDCWTYDVQESQPYNSEGWHTIGSGSLDLGAETGTGELIEAARQQGGPWADVEVVGVPSEFVAECPPRRQPCVYPKPATAF